MGFLWYQRPYPKRERNLLLRYHLRIEAVGPKSLRGKTVGEQYGSGVARTKPKRKIVRGITPANIQQAAAL